MLEIKVNATKNITIYTIVPNNQLFLGSLDSYLLEYDKKQSER